MKKEKIIYTVFASALLMALYLVIFGFSSQDGEMSGTVSGNLSRLGAELINGITGGRIAGAALGELASWLEQPLRKLAHFAEYAAAGALVYSIVLTWSAGGKRWIFASAVWVALSATADELHQYFVPGRFAGILDVLLDTCGGIFGIFVCQALFSRALERRQKKARRKETRTD